MKLFIRVLMTQIVINFIMQNYTAVEQDEGDLILRTGTEQCLRH